MNVSTNFYEAVRVANKIAKQQMHALRFHAHHVVALLFRMVHALTSQTSHIKG
ncbi:hypothetical protein KIN20_020240 [Parelaphostrongylus tenuis]|uniref:Uncharacterized protein n=1 Tax=Parelaphostrongylus tenuis TaxID=148309 RepID=A0AAD5N5P9_PARTN|nr:hypothetical protein KIN20_020240 [Parelaphostrongylus tenuis]